MAPQSTNEIPPTIENVVDNDPEKQRSLIAGQKLASPLPGEEVVISGMAGMFPDSYNVEHFKENLYNKVDLISSDERRYKHEHPEIPKRAGKLFDVQKFDAGFFGYPHFQVATLDPMCRILLERVFEVIVDAGYHPSELQGTKTGVYVGACESESESITFFAHVNEADGEIQGNVRSMIPNQISYFFKFNGPSIINDTACSSSLYSFEQAYKDIRSGRCDYAVVCGANLCLHPYVSLQFARLGVLSLDGACKCFDNDANGYARSEGIVCVFLERSKDARRIYANVLHAKTNCDGFKEQGITYPSGEVQKGLLEDFYKEVQIPPNSLSYMEAHGTGTKVGDPEELQTIDEVFCTNRDRPLLIGSVKSNIGHNEPSSGVCSIIKVLIGMENGYIPPNLNFKTIRKGVQGLESGRMKVVDEKTPWQDNNGLVGINSFGFGGGNSHILLKWNKKIKNTTTPSRSGLPKLVCLSGRVKDATSTLFESVLENNMDADHIALLGQIFKKHIPGHNYRAYMICDKNGEIQRSEMYYDEVSKPLCLVFGSADKKWATIGHYLFSIPLFAASIQRIHNVYEKSNLPANIAEIINSYKSENQTHHNMGTFAIQLSLFEVLKHLNIVPKSALGYSLGALVSSYVNNIITFDEAVLLAYYASLTFNIVFDKNDKSYQLQTTEIFTNYVKQTCKNLNENQVKQLVKNVLVWKKENIQKLLTNDSITCVIGSALSLNVKTGLGVNLVDICETSAVESFLSGVGKLYQLGFDVVLADLYPKVEFPVARGTPIISSRIKWNHENDWYVMNYKEWVDQHYGFKVIPIVLKNDEWNYLAGHVIDGRNLFPATGYLCLVWTLFASMLKQMVTECRVVFENVRFIQAVNIPKSNQLNLTFTIQKQSGLFEVAENDMPVVTGRIYQFSDDKEVGSYTHVDIKYDNLNTMPLTTKDVYKELKLRGYNYSGLFKGIKSVNQESTIGQIEWKDNYTAFMDNMLQMKILQEDSRNLYVPTGIGRLIIDPRSHQNYVGSLESDNPTITVYANKQTNVIRTDFIEIRGLQATPIPKRKQLADPVLETYKFIPNETKLSFEESVRTCLQITLENVMTVKSKIVEVPNKNIELPEDYKYLTPIFQQVLGDLPLMQPELMVLTEKTVELSGIAVENKNLNEETGCLIVAVANALENEEELLEISNKVLREGGMILCRENTKVRDIQLKNFHKIAVHEVEDELFVLLQMKSNKAQPKTFVEIPNNEYDFSWLEKLKQTAQNTNQEIILYSYNDTTSGIIGLVNCLRREPNGEKFKAVYIQEMEGPLNLKDSFITEQLDKNLAINIFKDGQWGTYRHILLSESNLTQSEHTYAIVGTPGDLSTLKWIEGTLKYDGPVDSESELVKVNYCALNFRDVMTASGKISTDVITRDRTKQMCVQGFEFVGKTADDRKVFGIVASGALGSLVSCRKDRMWPVPSNWTMPEAATCGAVYLTVIVALIQKGKIKQGDSVLIHSGTGGVGQAAINIASYFGCTIFTTVGTQEKREFIRNHFPNIKESHIGNSRDTSFEQMVMYHTKGKGVDLVLNSLSDEKLRASVRCLAKGGHFLEIGKFDLANDNPLMLQIFARGASFHSIMLDWIMDNRMDISDSMHELFMKMIKNGAVKPLQRTEFRMNELEQAFRFMATGKHMGKVLIKIRNDDQNSTEQVKENNTFSCYKRYYCDSDKTFVIIGGLGGFGLELADWLVLRNARKIILTSRNGITTGYQALRISIWRSYGVEVVVSTEDVTDKTACKKLLEIANKMGPVQAIFNLGVVLRDAILENQTVEDFRTSFAPKAYATKYLDELSRVMCPKLRDFVIFSSVSCGRGNAGQTNYGMANSIMERICEQRKKDGFPGLAIEWGAIGDVGLVAEMQESNTEIVIGGTLQQRIASCLSVMDTFLHQSSPIVSSMVVAEKRSSGNFGNAIDAVVNILGLRNVTTISPHQTFPELGMDSIMAVEIKQILETEYEVVFSPQDIRSMTFARIYALEKEKNSGEGGTKTKNAEEIIALNAFEAFLDSTCGQNDIELKKPYIITTSNVSTTQHTPITILVPGVEGYATIMQPLANNMTNTTACLQYPDDVGPVDIKKIALQLLPHTKEIIGTDKLNFRLVAYSYGVLVALELIVLLESEGYSGKVLFIDGSPDVMRELCARNFGEVLNQNFYYTKVLCTILSKYIKATELDAFAMKLLQKEKFEDKVDLCMVLLPKDFPYSCSVLTEIAKRFAERTMSVLMYERFEGKITSPCLLVRPKSHIVYNYDHDYKLGEYCETLVDVKFVDGDHVSVLGVPELSTIVDQYFNE